MPSIVSIIGVALCMAALVGLAGFIQKPYQLAELLNAVKKVLDAS